jgi:hypothetical protein
VDDSIITTLQNRISQLEGDCATLRAEAKDRRLKARALREENERFANALEETAQERDRYKQAIEAEPHELQTQVDSLRGQIRDRDHRDRFKTLAQAAGVNSSKALDDLYQLSGYKPEADEIDEVKIKAAIGQALQGRDWLKSSAPAPGGANGGAPARRRGRTLAKKPITHPDPAPRAAGPHAWRMRTRIWQLSSPTRTASRSKQREGGQTWPTISLRSPHKCGVGASSPTSIRSISPRPYSRTRIMKARSGTRAIRCRSGLSGP